MMVAELAAEYDVARLVELAAKRRLFDETAQELVLNSLREAILVGLIPPSARLRQEALASAFDVSRIPVREALRSLEYDGLVTSEPHRGFTVTGLDADEIEEIYELRTVLEGHAVRLAIPLLTEQDITELEALYEEMENTQDANAKLVARERFYLRLYGVTARPRLVRLILRLYQDIARSLRGLLIQQSTASHNSFFTAVKEGDADRACAELAAHHRKVAALLRRFLRDAKDASRRPGGVTWTNNNDSPTPRI